MLRFENREAPTSELDVERGRAAVMLLAVISAKAVRALE
jgi:hypothetical protein